MPQRAPTPKPSIYTLRFALFFFFLVCKKKTICLLRVVRFGSRWQWMYRMYSSCQSERGSTHRCPVSAHTPQACTIQKGSGSKRDQNIFSTGILQREMRKWCNRVGEGGRDGRCAGAAVQVAVGAGCCSGAKLRQQGKQGSHAAMYLQSSGGFRV